MELDTTGFVTRKVKRLMDEKKQLERRLLKLDDDITRLLGETRQVTVKKSQYIKLKERMNAGHLHLAPRIRRDRSGVVSVSRLCAEINSWF